MKYPHQVDTEAVAAEPERHLPAVVSPRHDATFERLFRQQYGPVRQLLYRMLGDETADDLAQETFLALYNHPPQPRMSEDAIRAWLYRVALNRGYNSLRARRRLAATLAELDVSEYAPDPETEALRGEERQRVRAALAMLPERQAKLLVLRQQEGLKYAEIAAILDVAASSIGTLLVRAERAFQLAWNQLNTTPSACAEQGEHTA
ncbi:MAG TPA: sigma-70 family RNA polymerase sigma factor [Ktedonobacterales bacterium]|nr:sigma-70 family RNA polymerase sigma factor [Ktedonobacterales bacterium]